MAGRITRTPAEGSGREPQTEEALLAEAMLDIAMLKDLNENGDARREAAGCGLSQKLLEPQRRRQVVSAGIERRCDIAAAGPAMPSFAPGCTSLPLFVAVLGIGDY